MEYYSVIKKKELLLFLTTWMDPEGIILSEIFQTEKYRYHMISLMWNQKTPQMNKIIDIVNR